MALQDHREDGLDRMPTAEAARKGIGGGSAYLSFDVDSLDPVYAPGTGTPEPGGLTTLEAQRLIRDLGSLDFVGADLVEVSPPFDTGGITSMTDRHHPVRASLRACAGPRPTRAHVAWPR